MRIVWSNVSSIGPSSERNRIIVGEVLETFEKQEVMQYVEGYVPKRIFEV